jgi:hypothetical protein
MSVGDVNLRGIFFMFGTFFSIAVAAAAAAAAIARILPVCVCGLIFIIFGRGFRRHNTLSPLLLFD